ncbi:MAG: hypothetical protein Q7R85_00440 [bacterium]|nr:hypothetical protein [bacterium]
MDTLIILGSIFGWLAIGFAHTSLQLHATHAAFGRKDRFVETICGPIAQVLDNYAILYILLGPAGLLFTGTWIRLRATVSEPIPQPTNK